ncbi:hypothetical protein [Ensifer sp. 4252]|uniref:hypothetical protein n=1 Tax=Ensifer sp. 4252 TaxID=3373915 RepID=UPI003D216466
MPLDATQYVTLASNRRIMPRVISSFMLKTAKLIRIEVPAIPELVIGLKDSQPSSATEQTGIVNG